MHFVMGKVQDDGFAGNYNSVEGLLHFHQKIKKKSFFVCMDALVKYECISKRETITCNWTRIHNINMFDYCK